MKVVREFDVKLKLINTGGDRILVHIEGPGEKLWVGFGVSEPTVHMNMRAVDVCDPLIKRIRKELKRGKSMDRD